MTIQPPLTTAAGTSFGLTVSVEDAFGNLATTFAGSVTVALATSTGGSVLAGTTTITASQGIATFSGLSLDTAGSGYTLEATGNGLSSTTSRAFSITAGPAVRLSIATTPPGTVAAGSSFGLVVAADDAFGNLATSWGGSVTVALATDPGAAHLAATPLSRPTRASRSLPAC